MCPGYGRSPLMTSFPCSSLNSEYCRSWCSVLLSVDVKAEETWVRGCFRAGSVVLRAHERKMRKPHSPGACLVVDLEA